MAERRQSLIHALRALHAAVERNPDAYDDLRPHLQRLLDLIQLVPSQAADAEQKRALIAERVVLHRSKRLLQYGPNRNDESSSP